MTSRKPNGKGELRFWSFRDSGRSTAEGDAFGDSLKTPEVLSFVSSTTNMFSVEIHRFLQLSTQRGLEEYGDDERSSSWPRNLAARQTMLSHAQTAVLLEVASREASLRTVLYEAGLYARQRDMLSEAEGMSKL